MNAPRAVIGFVNAAHFIDHYAMLIFAAAVIVMAPIFGTDYATLLPYAAPGFMAFGAGSLLSGWLGDRWSRRHMMVIYFFGIGAALVATGFVTTPLQLGIGLFAVGAFASIYHPVGTAMMVAHSRSVGRDIGINGVWGNLGVASSAMVTGAVAHYIGWNWAFILPGAAAIGLGIAFMTNIRHEAHGVKKSSGEKARLPAHAMRRVIAALAVIIIATSVTYNAITIALPKLLAERLTDLTTNTAQIGFIAAAVYVCGALTQYTIGTLLDRFTLKDVFLPLSFILAPLLYLAVGLSGVLLLPVAAGVIVGLFGQVTINDAMVAKYTNDEWRSRAYAVRYFVGFTAAGASVGLVSWLYARGGFDLMLEAFAGLCLLMIGGALLFPVEERTQAEAP